MPTLVLIALPAALFLVPAFLRDDWLYSHVALVMAVLAIALDYSGRDDSGCGFCDAIAGAYFAYLAIATITGLLARSAVKALRSCGVASCYAWLPLPAGLILIAALPFAIIL